MMCTVERRRDAKGRRAAGQPGQRALSWGRGTHGRSSYRAALHPSCSERPPTRPLPLHPPTRLPQCYSPAWEAGQADVRAAAQRFERALLELSPEAQLVESVSGGGSEYRRWRVASRLFGHDDVE